MPDLRKRTMFVASGAVIGNIAALAVAAILSRLLTKEVYGTYRQVFFVYRTLLAIMGLNRSPRRTSAYLGHSGIELQQPACCKGKLQPEATFLLPPRFFLKPATTANR